jgi:hypothetical protein
MDDETGLVAPPNFAPNIFILMMQAWIEKKFKLHRWPTFNVVKSLQVPDVGEEIILAGVVESNVHRKWFKKSVQNEIAKKTTTQDMAFALRCQDVGNSKRGWISFR